MQLQQSGFSSKSFGVGAEAIEKELKLGLVKNPICRRFFFLFRIIGVIITMCSMVADYTYAFKQTFSSRDLFIGYLSVLAFRCTLPILLAIKNVCRKVCSREKNRLGAAAYEIRDDAESVYKKQTDHTKAGCILYTALPVAYFTGGYRLLDFKNFPGEIGCGLALDFFLNVLPLLFLQGINNATLTA